MNLEDYIAGVIQRYKTLEDTQKETLISFISSEEGQIVSYVLGPEMSGIIGELKKESPPIEIQPMPEEQELPVRRGLGLRP